VPISEDELYKILTSDTKDDEIYTYGAATQLLHAYVHRMEEAGFGIAASIPAALFITTMTLLAKAGVQFIYVEVNEKLLTDEQDKDVDNLLNFLEE
jgi:hypothetical protein